MSPERLDELPEGSPARAFLGWFRALQQRNSAAAVRYYSASVGLSREELHRQRRAARREFDPLGPPRITRVVKKGSHAVVYARLRKVTAAPNGRVDKEYVDTRGFRFMRERGDWKLAGNRFLETLSGTPPGGSAKILARNGHEFIELSPGKRFEVVPGAVNGRLDFVVRYAKVLVAQGWAADTSRRRPADRVLLFGQGRLLGAGRLKTARPDVVETYGPSLRKSGFKITSSPQNRSVLANPSNVRVFAVAGRRASELEPTE